MGKTFGSLMHGVDTTGWLAPGGVWTYDNYDATHRTGVVSTSSDETDKIEPGNRIQIEQPSGTKHAIVTAIDAVSITFLLYIGDVLVNESITDSKYSRIRQPLGFDLDSEKWDMVIEDNQTLGQVGVIVNQKYNLGISPLPIPIGAWEVSYDCSAQSNSSTETTKFYRTYFSTTTTTETHPSLTASLSCTTERIRQQANRATPIKVSATTQFYLLIEANTATDALYIAGADHLTVLRAKCAYL